MTVASAAGYTIYPVPQQQVATSGQITLTAGQVDVICGTAIDVYTQKRIQNILIEHQLITSDTETLFVTAPTSGKSHIYIGVNGSGDAADVEATRLGLERTVFSKDAKYDRHIVALATGADGAAEVVVLGEHTDAAFIGLASVEQILDTYASQGFTIPCGVIYDYADQQNRGIVEGYYGVPYSAEVKKDLMRFMMRYKMNSYMYGAKSDPYHSTYWKDPYPTTITEAQREMGYLSQDMLREITDVAHDTKVNFVWAIHPGNNFLGSSTVVDDIMAKYRKMYDLGIRQFGVFVDDVSIPTTESDYQLNATRLTALQRAIEAEWNTDGATPADTVKPIQFVPQLYCGGFAGSEDQRKGFFEALATTPSNVAIYTTGWGVWSVPNSSDVNSVRQYLGRDVAWWWNYPCNDNDANKLFTMDMYTNFKDESKISNSARPDASLSNCLGVLSNPMQQGEVAKIAFFGIADYAWNNAAFNNSTNWEASFPAIFTGDTEKAEALRTLAPYLRYYDSDALSKLVSDYKARVSAGLPDGTALRAEMQSVIDAADRVARFQTDGVESDSLLYVDMAPWLAKLRTMATNVIGLLNAVEGADDAARWDSYVAEMPAIAAYDTNSDFLAPQLAGYVGATLSLTTTKALPANETLAPFVTYLKENALGTILSRNVASRARMVTNLAKASGSVLTSNGIVAASGTNTLTTGDYVGIEMPQPTRMDAVTINDTLTDHFAVLYSVNGKDWKRVTDGTTEGYIRYICVKNESDETRALRMNRNVLSLTLPVTTQLDASGTTIPSGDIYDSHTATYLTDGDYTTYTCLNKNQVTGDAYVVKLKTARPVYDVRVCVGTVNDDYMNAGRIQTSVDGKTWKTLKIKGTNTSDLRMTSSQVVKYSDEMSYCDFQGTGDTVQYVRLYVSNANTSKWLRLYEIEVNGQYDREAYAPDVTAASATNRLSTLTDSYGYTPMSDEISASASELTYNFYSHNALTGVRIFQDAAAAGKGTILLSEDGEEWTNVGTLTGGMQEVDMSAHPLARYMKITWTEGQLPGIYEIVEVADETTVAEVTRIRRIEASSDLSVVPSAQGVAISAAAGIAHVTAYSTEGRLLFSQSFQGLPSVSIPSLNWTAGTGKHGIAILRITTVDGNSTTVKVIL